MTPFHSHTPLYILLSLLLLFFSCRNEEDINPGGSYEEGILISNEGNFSDVDGSVSFFNPNASEYRSKIFEKENSRPFGGLLQSIGLHNQYAYLIDNFGSRIEVVEVGSFKSIKTISAGLSLPRYFVAEGSEGFISNWGPYSDDFDSPDSFIAILDTEENLIGEIIPVPSRPEGLIIHDGKLYVSSLASDEITVIDIFSHSIITTIKTAFGPSHFVVDGQGYLWVTCSAGILLKIDPVTNGIIERIEIENLDGKLTIDGIGETIYLMTSSFSTDFSFTENSILKLDIFSPEAAAIIFSARNLYGIGIDPRTDEIYLANSNAFLGNGTIIRIDKGGYEIDNFPSGRGPNGFVFRN
jgi:YVTN family beta-propeller protein